MSLLTAAVCASILSAPGSGAGGDQRIPAIPFEKYTLPNGLDVILHEDHSTPIVAVNLWYHVGSKNERPGRTGFAHLFEHMMFQGSEHHDSDYFGPLQKAGGRLNGSTSQDRTNYWETVPSNYLELALWMEADRMGFLLPVMTQKRLDNQRSVVKNERRQSYDNRPYGLAYETILAALYPPQHPYSWPVIGSMADLDAASREDIANFFRRFYHPRNASLSIAGDFRPDEAKRWAAKYFGALPAGPRAERVSPPAGEMATDQRIQMKDRVGLARLYLVWHSVHVFAKDDAELEILAEILSGGKTSRLYRSLVRDKQIAQDVQVHQNSGELAGMLMVVATARPGHTLAELETACLEEITRIQDAPPSDEEVVRAVNRLEAQFVSALEPIGDFGGRADRLNMYNTYTGDPGYLTKDFERYLTVTPQAVQRVARDYLGRHRVTLEITPGPAVEITPDPRETAAEARRLAAASDGRRTPDGTAGAAGPAAGATGGLSASAAGATGSASASAGVEPFDRSLMPGPSREPKFTLPPIRRRKLSNGLDVLVVENHKLPTVNLNLVFRTGRSSDPADKNGLTNLLATVWDEGTSHRTADQIAEGLAGIGATLHVVSDWDTTAARLFTLKRHLAPALDIYADVLQNPTFPEKELDRQRNIALGRLAQVRDEPVALAGLAVGAVLYGPQHPYGRPQYGSPATLKSINSDDLRAFYRARFHPDQAALVAAGDVTADEIVGQMNERLSSWKPEPATGGPERFPAPAASEPTQITLIDRPGAVQSVITVSLPGVSRASPDYFPLVVMNSIFGGQFSSRLNMNLRERKGYTYGARTAFDWRVHEPGPFTATASVQTAVTAPALAEFLKEFAGMVGGHPVGEGELEFSKTYLTRGYAAGFETPNQVASQLETLVEFGLPDDYFNTVVPGIRAATTADVLRVAKNVLDVEHLAVIIVGDRSQIEPALRRLPIGGRLGVFRFDEEFRMVPAAGQ
jgi:zinc protease